MLMKVEWILLQRRTDLVEVDCLHTLHVIISTEKIKQICTQKCYIYIYIFMLMEGYIYNSFAIQSKVS